MNITGLDLSLTGTGVAWISSKVSVCTIRSKGRRLDSVAERHNRLHSLATDIVDAANGSHLVVIEAGITVKGGSNWDRAGLWWMVVHRLIDRDIPVAAAAPATVKKFAAGRGNADKAAVAVGIARLWPDLECSNDNEYDSVALATMGAQYVGMDVPSRAHHADTIKAVAWPEFIDTGRNAA